MPPPVVLFGVLPPGLLHDTNAWTRLLCSLLAFLGCWKSHCACAALAAIPTTNTAASATSRCLFMGTLLRRGWLVTAITRALVRSTTHRVHARLIVIGFSTERSALPRPDPLTPEPRPAL